MFSDPGQLRRDLGLASRVVTARNYLGSSDEAIPKKLIKDAYKLADDSPELGDKIKMLELGVKLDRQELANEKHLGHAPFARDLPNANSPRRPEDDPDVIDGKVATAEEPMQIAFQEAATDEQLEQTFAVAERYSILELLQPGRDAVDSEGTP